MIISVISPLHQVGRTMSSAVIASALSQVGNKRVCLTHVDFSDTQLNEIFGIKVEADATTSLSYVVSLLQNNAVNGEQIVRYLHNLDDKLSLFIAPETKADEYEILDMYSLFLSKLNVFDYTIVDLDINMGLGKGRNKEYESKLEKSTARSILEVSDLIIVICNTDLVCQEECVLLRKELEGRYRIPKSKVMFCANTYSSDIRQYQKIARKLGINKNQLMTINYNSKLAVAKNAGTLQGVVEKAIAKETGHLRLLSDMKNINRIITKPPSNFRFLFFGRKKVE